VTKVLIADDHPMVLSGIESVLAGSRFEVVGRARDGVQVLDALSTARPDVLVVDLQMPERTGLDVLRTLRSKGDLRPVVFLMADINEKELREALQLGVSGVILKKSAPSQLLMCLEHVHDGQRWIDQALMERTLNATLGNDRSPAHSLDSLAPRERAIARLVAAGLRNKEIGDELGVTEGTVKVVLHRMYVKLGVANRVELALAARDLTTGEQDLNL
jgi:two-component system nitrate/nitrite response regulator NarP